MSARDARRRRLALLSGGYAALAIAATWPLARHPSTQVPLGTLDSATVPFLSTWTLWWTSDRLLAGLAGFWSAPILYPAQSVFAHGEPMPLLGIVAAPLFWMGVPSALIYNGLVWVALISSGLVAYGLMRSLGQGRRAAAAGGAMMVLLPATHRELGVLTLVPLGGLLGTLWALVAFQARPTARRGLLLGSAFAASYWICGQHAMFLALAASLASLCLLRRDLLRPSALAALATAALASAVLIAPLALGQLDALRGRGLSWSPEAAAASSANGDTWRAAAWRPLLPIPGERPAQGPHRRAEFPGTLKLALALAAVLWGLRRRESRQLTAFLASLALVAFAVSVLPHIQLGEVSLYVLLREALPGVAQIRAFSRAAVLVQIAVVLLAAQALHALLAAGPAPRLRAAAAALLATLAIVELWPHGQGFGDVPSRAAWRPFAAWVEEQVRPGEVMAYFPFVDADLVAQFENDARWMWLQRGHGRAMVNGYASYIPATRSRFAQEVAGFPDARSHRHMRALAVRWAVVPLPWLRNSGRPEPREPRWRRAHLDPEHQLAVYEVLPTPERDP